MITKEETQELLKRQYDEQKSRLEDKQALQLNAIDKMFAWVEKHQVGGHRFKYKEVYCYGQMQVYGPPLFITKVILWPLNVKHDIGNGAGQSYTISW